MNIYLIPYITARHFVLALVTSGAALLAWFAALVWIVAVGPFLYENMALTWTQSMEGPFYLGFVAGTIAFTTMLAEGSLRRRKLRYRLGYAAMASGLTVLLTWLFYSVASMATPKLSAGSMADILSDGSLVTLRFRIFTWSVAGFCSGLGPFLTRMIQDALGRRFGWGVDARTPMQPFKGARAWTEFFAHTSGGVVGASLGAAAWHTLGLYTGLQGDLYLAAAAGPFVWGALYGLLVWPLPDDLYAGWIRVLSAERFGLRIPVPHVDGTPAERFVGHFPRGLDLYLPADQGVAELHASIVVNSECRYAVRGLSIQPTVVKRFLERVDLRYDPRRPAPLETTLNMEDRIFLGDDAQTQMEFLLLPKEER